MSSHREKYVKSYVTGVGKFTDSAHPDARVESFIHHKHLTSDHPIWSEELNTTGPLTSNDDLGATNVKYQFVRSGINRGVLMELKMAQTGTASYCDYIGITAILKVKLYHASNLIMDYDYVTVLLVLFKYLKPEVVVKILRGAGGTSTDSTAGITTYCSWIPMFWDQIINPSAGGLNLADLSNAHFEIRLDYRAASLCIESGATGAAISSSLMVLENVNTTQPIRDDNYTIHSINFDTIARVSLATATEALVNLKTFDKHNKELVLIMQDKTEVDKNLWLYAMQLPDYVKMTIDSTEAIIYEEPTTYDLKSIFYQKTMGYSSTFTYFPVTIPFSEYNMGVNLEDNTGSLNGNDFSNWTLKFIQSTGSTVYYSICAITSATYAIKDGLMFRVT